MDIREQRPGLNRDLPLSERRRLREIRRRKQRIKLCLILGGFAAAVIALIIAICVLISSVRKPTQEEMGVLKGSVMPINSGRQVTVIQQFAENNECYITNERIELKGLMLHSVGASQPSAAIFARNYNTFNPANAAACPHAFLQSDGTVYQVLPWEMRGWHAGGSANNNYIGVEMCEPEEVKYTGANSREITDPEAATEYVQGTYESAVILFAQLCETYGLHPLKEGVIISHLEGSALGIASDHGDPENVWRAVGLDYSMDTFRADVFVYMTTHGMRLSSAG